MNITIENNEWIDVSLRDKKELILEFFDGCENNITVIVKDKHRKSFAKDVINLTKL